MNPHVCHRDKDFYLFYPYKRKEKRQRRILAVILLILRIISLRCGIQRSRRRKLHILFILTPQSTFAPCFASFTHFIILRSPAALHFCRIMFSVCCAEWPYQLRNGWLSHCINTPDLTLNLRNVNTTLMRRCSFYTHTHTYTHQWQFTAGYHRFGASSLHLWGRQSLFDSGLRGLWQDTICLRGLTVLDGTSAKWLTKGTVMAAFTDPWG